MKKQVKLLSLITMFTVAGINADGGLKGFCKNPVEFGKTASGSSNVLTKGLVAVGLGIVASTVADRDYDEKGAYKSVTKDTDPMMEDAMYCVAGGAGWSFVEAMSDLSAKKQTMTDMGKESLLNAAALWVTNMIAKQPVYRSIDRNHFLLKGWVPFNLKLDDTFKKIIVAYGTRGILKTLPGMSTSGSALTSTSK
jgi:hypothetical protein